jgi:hypothetical protein
MACNGWLDGLDAALRAVALETMRRLRAESDQHLLRHEQLRPRYGEIAVGGGAFDEFLAGETIAVFLSAISRGATPAAAADAAKADARLMVEKWNQSRADYQVHRWVNTMDAKIDDVARRFR